MPALSTSLSSWADMQSDRAYAQISRATAPCGHRSTKSPGHVSGGGAHSELVSWKCWLSVVASDSQSNSMSSSWALSDTSERRIETSTAHTACERFPSPASQPAASKGGVDRGNLTRRVMNNTHPATSTDCTRCRSRTGGRSAAEPSDSPVSAAPPRSTAGTRRRPHASTKSPHRPARVGARLQTLATPSKCSDGVVRTGWVEGTAFARTVPAELSASCFCVNSDHGSVDSAGGTAG